MTRDAGNVQEDREVIILWDSLEYMKKKVIQREN